MAPARTSPAAIDIGWSSLKALQGERGIEVAVERRADGRLTDGCRERVARHLSALRGRGRGRKIPCGVPSRGVSLRRFTLPASPRDEIESLLALQVERELPLPSAMVAWGYQAHANGALAGPPARARNGAPVQVTVALLRRELLDDYEAALRDAGFAPAFVPGILAAAWACPEEPGRSLLLDIGKTRTEALLGEDGRPIEVKTIPWGGDAVTGEVARALGLGLPEAEEAKRRWGRSLEGGFVLSPAAGGDGIFVATRIAVDRLASVLEEWWAAGTGTEAAGRPSRIHLTGGGARLAGLPEALAERLGGAIPCRALPLASGEGRSAVTLGLARTAAAANGDLPLVFLPPARRRKETSLARRRASLAFWIAAAAVLVAAAAALRYAPPILRLPGLARRVEEARARRSAMPELDRELGFLDLVEKSQPPYLEALLAAARSIPSGTVFDAMTMNRQGEVSVQGKASSFEAANDLRGKLAASGWFSQVVLLDQSPSKERERIDFRLTARMRAGPALAATRPETGPANPAGAPPPPGSVVVPAAPAPFPGGPPPAPPETAVPPSAAAAVPGGATPPPAASAGADPDRAAAPGRALLPGKGMADVKIKVTSGAGGEAGAAPAKAAAPAADETRGEPSK